MPGPVFLPEIRIHALPILLSDGLTRDNFTNPVNILISVARVRLARR